MDKWWLIRWRHTDTMTDPHAVAGPAGHPLGESLVPLQFRLMLPNMGIHHQETGVAGSRAWRTRAIKLTTGFPFHWRTASGSMVWKARQRRSGLALSGGAFQRLGQLLQVLVTQSGAVGPAVKEPNHFQLVLVVRDELFDWLSIIWAANQLCSSEPGRSLPDRGFWLTVGGAQG